MGMRVCINLCIFTSLNLNFSPLVLLIPPPPPFPQCGMQMLREDGEIGTSIFSSPSQTNRRLLLKVLNGHRWDCKLKCLHMEHLLHVLQFLLSL